MFKDIPLAFDFAAPSGNTYILNRRNLFIRYMLWMKAFPPQTPVNQFIDVVKILTIYNMRARTTPAAWVLFRPPRRREALT
jgi:hypothetical protein